MLLVYGPDAPGNRTHVREVARLLNDSSIATLTIGVLSPDEDGVVQDQSNFRRELWCVSDRIVNAIDWFCDQPAVDGLPVGCYATHAASASALIAAARLGRHLRALVLHQGRPDLSEPSLRGITTPSMFVCAARDERFVEMNRKAISMINGPTELLISAHHPMYGNGVARPDTVARSTARFFERYLSH